MASMNVRLSAPQVPRRPRRHRRLAGAAALLAALAVATAAAVVDTAPPGRLFGFTREGTERQRREEEILQSIPDPRRIESALRTLTEEPHMAGTPRNNELAEYVRDRWREAGLEDIHFTEYPALLSYPRSVAVTLVAPVVHECALREDPYPRDKDSYTYADPAQIPFSAYAADGDVTAEVVYANSGSPEDFAELERLGIDVRGRIVLVRYSVPYSYRGHKVYLAEQKGAAGVLLYSDPADDGYVKGDVYPHGPWGPDSHIQWGAIIYDFLGPGEPLTFGWVQQGDRWVEKERARQLPRIPATPISHRDAAVILEHLGGPAAPAGWQGGLPFAYHAGPGPARVRLRVDLEEEVRPIRNVIGRLRGAEEPDRWVIIGNHRDAWIYGGLDPSSGTAAQIELARALGDLVRRGQRPRRTIVFANWDAEEPLLGGSNAWGNANAEELRRAGVVYINVDSAAAGPLFDGSATPSLTGFLLDATRAVVDPGTQRTLYDAWKARSPGGNPEVGIIVAATDTTVFQGHVGMACIDMSFDGPHGVYHSQYDNFYWMTRLGDPGLLYNAALTRLWGVVTWRLANAALLPMDFTGYAERVLGYLEDLERRAPAGPSLDLGAAKAAARRWRAAARAVAALAEGRLERRDLPPAPALREVNDLFLRVERDLTEPTGLKGRPWLRHLIYAPQPTYRPEFLPRLREALERGDREALPAHAQEITEALNRAADTLERAADLLR
jgi:N-acetylated-alpha-linked acidic dipeptidase